jgi:hypothetical protein
MLKTLGSTSVLNIKLPIIPKSWSKAAGLASKKKDALEKHVEEIRKDWNKG